MRRDAPTYLVSITPRGQKGEVPEPIDLSDRVTSISIKDNESKADTLQITVRNFDLTQTDSPYWKKGQVFRFQWGYPGNMSPVREGVIMKTKGSLVMTIEANAKSVLMDTELKSRLFENQKRSDVVTTIARENGYTGDRVQVEDTEVEYESIQQAQMSDAQFLKHLANKENFEFFVDHTGLHWHERQLDQAPVRELVYYTSLTGDILGWGHETDIKKRPSQVKTKGRDPLTKKDIGGEGSDKTTPGKTVLGDFIELIDKVTGESSGTSAINTANDETIPTSETSDAGADRVAKQRYKRGLTNTIKLSLNVVPDPSLAAKSVIVVSGLGERLSGRYYITTMTAKLSESGAVQSLECRRNGASKNPGLNGDRGEAASGSRNKKDAKDPDKPSSIEKIDPVDGTAKIVYRDDRGRSPLK